MRTIGVITTARSDYGIYRPLLSLIKNDPDLRLHLMVSGMHLSPQFGSTVTEIEADGFVVDERIESILTADTPEGMAGSIGLGVTGFALAYSKHRPDVLVVLGDRFEMFAAALAAVPFRIPLAHIHGGEVTEGALDDVWRHCLTKMSHLHFVSTAAYGARVRQLGEEQWRIHVSGALSLDNVRVVKLVSREELAQRFKISIPERFVLVTFHSVTTEYENTGWQCGELLAALSQTDFPVLFTMPNADPGGSVIRRMIQEYLHNHSNAQAVENLGTEGYFSAMSLASAMVGNSSSGIVEAAPFKLPVVNVGTRQKGRILSANIINTTYQRDEISKAITQATADSFRENLADLISPYGDGHAAERIVRVLRETNLDAKLLSKSFQDYLPN
ncbi:MAG TPA: UDP-N-acetylglucosamine 2-epimerase (hydrolyzing) [Blastocatellia bacterium]|nr:UDP-N-acetylglucosamine 2-epimerase (hydrolyzing) [Blastocatellia bacterium]